MTGLSKCVFWLCVTCIPFVALFGIESNSESSHHFTILLLSLLCVLMHIACIWIQQYKSLVAPRFHQSGCLLLGLGLASLYHRYQCHLIFAKHSLPGSVEQGLQLYQLSPTRFNTRTNHVQMVQMKVNPQVSTHILGTITWIAHTMGSPEISLLIEQ